MHFKKEHLSSNGPLTPMVTNTGYAIGLIRERPMTGVNVQHIFFLSVFFIQFFVHINTPNNTLIWLQCSRRVLFVVTSKQQYLAVYTLQVIAS